MMTDTSYYTSEAVTLLQALIGIPSISREEDAAADFLQTYIEESGIMTGRMGNNVWCISPMFDTSKPTILLNSHIDTVKPVNGWRKQPFTPKIDNGKLFGLGSNDAGASLVSLFQVYKHLSATEQKYNLIFLASCEEEVSGKGGIEAVLPLLPRIDVAIVGEPTGMQPAIAEKGLMVLDGTITGIAGHAARNEGENAIYNAIDVINALRHAALERQSTLLGPVKVSVTQIEAGRQHNVVPDVCRIVVDVRTTDAYTNEETLELLRGIAGEKCTLVPRSTRLGPSAISPDHPLVRRLGILGKEPFGSPTLSDQALMPFPSLKIGPGDSARSHTADEYIEKWELRDAIQTYITLLDGCHI